MSIYFLARDEKEASIKIKSISKEGRKLRERGCKSIDIPKFPFAAISDDSIQ